MPVLGRIVLHPQKNLETFPAPAGLQEIVFHTDEFTSLCPVTGQPDYSAVTIRYAPDACCIESKSLKLYLWCFREEGNFCETLASVIWQDVMLACQPKWCEVMIEQKPRGGIALSAVAGRRYA